MKTQKAREERKRMKKSEKIEYLIPGPIEVSIFH
jgi:hypothetical protein